MQRLISLSALVLAGCVTTAEEMPKYPPKRIYHSQKPRSAVADCILDRLSSPERQPVRQEGADRTVVAFVYPGPKRDTFYHFTMVDGPGGTLVEARMLKGLMKVALPAAETCF